MPRFPTPQPAPPPTEKNRTGFWFGMAFLFFFATGFMGLISVILPDAIFLFAVLAGFVGMIALHYVTWGRWLSRITQDSAEREEDWPQPPTPQNVD